MSPYTPPRKPDSGLVPCNGDDAVDDDRSFRDTVPISLILAVGGPPIKNQTGPLYDGAALITPKGGNAREIWYPPRCGYQRPGCRPCRTHLATEAYTQSILPYRRIYREWKVIMKVQPSSQGDSGLPPGRGYRSAPEVARSAGVVLTDPVVVDPLLIVIF